MRIAKVYARLIVNGRNLLRNATIRKLEIEQKRTSPPYLDGQAFVLTPLTTLIHLSADFGNQAWQDNCWEMSTNINPTDLIFRMDNEQALCTGGYVCKYDVHGFRIDLDAVFNKLTVISTGIGEGLNIRRPWHGAPQSKICNCCPYYSYDFIESYTGLIKGYEGRCTQVVSRGTGFVCPWTVGMPDGTL